MSRLRLLRAVASAAGVAVGLPAAKPAPEGGLMNRSAHSLPVQRGRRLMCRIIGLMAVAGLSAGCVETGDFGRLRPELTAENMHDWIGRDASTRVGGPTSEFRTTDQERELRDRAYGIIDPPYNRNRWDFESREQGRGRKAATPPFDRTGYLAKLHRVDRRSEASAYAQIVSDARNEVEQLPAFFDVAARVADMDRRREQSLAHVANLNPRERANVAARTKENAAIVTWACQALRERLEAYRYALERMVIAVPNAGAAESDRAIELLKMRVGQYCSGQGNAVVARG
jgi:hypothetical protein